MTSTQLQTAVPHRQATAGPARFIRTEALSAGTMMAAAYLFILGSRISEIFSLHSIRLPAMLMILSLGAAGMAFLRGVRISTIGTVYVALTGIYVVSAIAGVWPGGSVNVLLDVWLRTLAVFIVVSTVPASLRECTLLVKGVAFGFFFIGIYTMLAGDGVAGRVGGGDTTSGDPNYIALAALYALPMLMFLASVSRRWLFRIACGGCALALMAVLVRTGSRGGVIAFVAMIGVWFLSASAKGKLVVSTLAVSAVMLAVLVAPAAILNRYTSILGDSASAGNAGESSARSRIHLFWRSVDLTIRNPLLGVGIGMFPVAENEFAVDLGARKGSWHVTHNMYTEVSSETGVFALGLFLTALFLTARNFGVIRANARHSTDPTLKKAADLALYLRLSLVSVAVGGAFLSVGYTSYIPILAGLSVSVLRVTGGLNTSSLNTRTAPGTMRKPTVLPPLRTAAGTRTPVY